AVAVLLRLSEDDLSVDETAVRRRRGAVRFRLERDPAIGRSAVLELQGVETLRRPEDTARRQRVRYDGAAEDRVHGAGRTGEEEDRDEDPETRSRTADGHR